MITRKQVVTAMKLLSRHLGPTEYEIGGILILVSILVSVLSLVIGKK